MSCLCLLKSKKKKFAVEAIYHKLLCVITQLSIELVLSICFNLSYIKQYDWTSDDKIEVEPGMLRTVLAVTDFQWLCVVGGEGG